MPIYEFFCNQCQKESEVLVRSSNWKGTPCPHCGSTRLDKKLSVFASAMGGEPGCDYAPACDMGKSSGCGGCCGGGPHSH